jgi:hypothetical protein
MWKIIFILLCIHSLSTLVHAESPEEKGLVVALEDSRRDNGFGDFTVDQIMVLTNRQGDESKRYIRGKTLEVDGDGDKSMVIFNRPKDVKGTVLLNYTHKTGDDNQWLYLPALKRVKRISSGNKSGPFVGSEFSYEDITSQEVEKYNYKWIKEESVKGLLCNVIERYPVYENSGYMRQIVWIDKEEYRIWKIEFYDRKNTLLKTLTFKGYQKYLDRFWYADEMHMVNSQTGKSTQLLNSNYKFETGLKPKNFNKNSLKRAR